MLRQLFQLQLPSVGGDEWVGEADRQRLLENAFGHVCERAKGAPFIYVLAAAAITLFTPVPTQHSAVMLGCVSFVIVSSALRFMIQVLLPRLGKLELAVRVKLFFVGISSTAVAWGAFTAATSVLYR
ncbi:MAG: hypothetical protein ACO3JL_13650, partial [Myxococcota bacterium]